jgi:hypothetical protein
MTPFTVPGGTANTITMQGLRASVSIDHAGGADMGTMSANIYGLTPSQLNQLTSLQWKTAILGLSSQDFSAYTVQVYAIDGSQETLLYNGQVLNAWADFSGMPQTCLIIQTNPAGAYSALVNSANPLSISSNTTVGIVMSRLAQAMGFSFQNTSSDGSIVNQAVTKGSYFGNTAMEQARSMMDAYRFWMYIDATTNPPTLAIVPWGKARKSVVAVPLISPQTGLIGYPLFNSSGVTFDCRYNPTILLGGQVKIQSSILQANDVWTVTSLSHQLTSQFPGGPWQSSVQAVSGDFGNIGQVLSGGGL